MDQKNFFAKAAFLVDKILSRPRIRLSNSRTLILDGVGNNVLLSKLAKQLRRKKRRRSRHLLRFFDAAGITPCLVLNQNVTVKNKEAGRLSKYKRQKLQLEIQVGAAHGSVRNLLKATILPMSKVRQFLHSKMSYRKITLARRKF